jgi:hypothetical protein
MNEQMNEQQGQNFSEAIQPAIGEPPIDMVLADVTSAAIAVTQNQLDLAAQVHGVPAIPVEAEVEDVSGAALPSAAYGDFVRKVGLAVADAQRALDENSVNAAVKLAQTKVPALIAMNQIINEDGELEKVEPVIQQDASLIQYIQPTFYQFSRVTMFARFNVSKLETDGTTKIQSSVSRSSTSGGAKVSGGFFGALFGGASAGIQSSTSRAGASSQVDSEFESASSSGSSSMLAVLEPRTDTRFPAPLIATQGPKLTMSAGANSLPAVVDNVPQTASISITLFKKGGFSNANNKTVDLILDGPGLLSTSSVVLAPVVNDPQRLRGTVTLSRRAGDAVGSATIRATLGGLTAVAGVDFV